MNARTHVLRCGCLLKIAGPEQPAPQCLPAAADGLCVCVRLFQGVRERETSLMTASVRLNLVWARRMPQLWHPTPTVATVGRMFHLSSALHAHKYRAKACHVEACGFGSDSNRWFLYHIQTPNVLFGWFGCFDRTHFLLFTTCSWGCCCYIDIFEGFMLLQLCFCLTETNFIIDRLKFMFCDAFLVF